MRLRGRRERFFEVGAGRMGAALGIGIGIGIGVAPLGWLVG